MRFVPFVFVAVFFILAGYSFAQESVEDNQEASFNIGGDFSLVDQDNNIVTHLSLLDQYTLIMFGFSRCPDICPNQLSILSSVMDKMYGRISVYFVTVDPEYDTVEVLREFHESFHEDIKMLTGTVEEIEKMKKQYKVYASLDKKDPERSSHSTIIYLAGKNGKYVGHLVPESPEQVVRDLKILIS